jgi:hypothetical protein
MRGVRRGGCHGVGTMWLNLLGLLNLVEEAEDVVG